MTAGVARVPRSLAAAIASAGVVWLLAGCAQLAPLPLPSTLAADSETFSGRLAIRVEPDGSADAKPRSFSAAFDLRGDPQGGVLGLSTPLGSMLARASWTAAEVTLVTPQERRRYPDLDALTREVLGESVPVEAWFDWLRGRPWPGAASEARSLGEPPQPGFAQLGWAVDVSRLGEGRVIAVRERPAPVVTVRIQLDRG